MMIRTPPFSKIILIAAMLLLVGCNAEGIDESPVIDRPDLPPPEQSTIESDAQKSNENSTEYVFEELGISLLVPDDLYIVTNADYNTENPSLLDSYQLYIQNYGFPEGPASGDFQIYGFYQFNLPKISWDEFAEIETEITSFEYINYVEIAGLRGFDTQYSGQRNRFVYLFHYLDGTLNFAVSEPTEANKILADQIILTLKIVGE
jgi:hypothetical protein